MQGVVPTFTLTLERVVWPHLASLRMWAPEGRATMRLALMKIVRYTEVLDSVMSRRSPEVNSGLRRSWRKGSCLARGRPAESPRSGWSRKGSLE